MIISYLLLYLLFFHPGLSKAQCIVDIGPPFLICGANTLPEDAPIGYNITLWLATPPLTYTWTANYNSGASGTYTASDILDDSTLQNPKLINYVWPQVDTLSRNWQQFNLKVTDAMGQTCEDSILVSYTEWYVNTTDCEVSINQGTSVRLQHNLAGGGVPPYAFAWSPNYAINDSTVGFPLVNPDTTTTYSLVLTDQVKCVFLDTCKVLINGTGIDPNQPQPVFSISENPLRTTAELTLEDPFLTRVRAEIVDMQGKLILEKAFTSSHIQMKASTFDPGVYLCRILNEDNQILAVKKLMVLH